MTKREIIQSAIDEMNAGIIRMSDGESLIRFEMTAEWTIEGVFTGCIKRNGIVAFRESLMKAPDIDMQQTEDIVFTLLLYAMIYTALIHKTGHMA